MFNFVNFKSIFVLILILGCYMVVSAGNNIKYQFEDEDLRVTVLYLTDNIENSMQSDSARENYVDITIYNKITHIENEIPLTVTSFKKYFSNRSVDIQRLLKDKSQAKLFKNMVKDFQIIPILKTNNVSTIDKKEVSK
jgi:hypothetical protein